MFYRSYVFVFKTFFLPSLRALAPQIRGHVVRSVPGGLSGRVVGPKGPAVLLIPMLAPAGRDYHTVLPNVVDWISVVAVVAVVGSVFESGLAVALSGGWTHVVSPASIYCQ
jgi:hypothetical protein